MRTVLVTMIGMSSILLVVMIQTSINRSAMAQENLETALAVSMSQTMSEVMEQDSYGIENRNEMIAAFLQAMIVKLNTDMDLTVRIYQVDYEKGQMDVEASGEVLLPNETHKKIVVRRKIAMV